MKTSTLLFSLFILSIPHLADAQISNTPSSTLTKAITCTANTFYGLTSTNDVVSLTINGSSVTNNGIISTSLNNINSLAVGNDLINGTSQHILYSSNDDSIKYNDGTTWSPVLFDPVTFHNAGGVGPFVYYMSNSFPSTITRFTGSALNTILVDSNLTFMVADIGVTNFGTIYYFAGSAATSHFMYEISSTGNLLNTYSMNLYTAGAYGCFVMNNTIYVGLGPSGSPANSLIPITISSGNAIVGSPIAMPAIHFKDLASCTGEVTNLNSLSESDPQLKLFPIPASECLNIETEIDESKDGYLKIFDINSRIILDKNINFNERNLFQQNISDLQSGIYFLTLQTKTTSYSKKFIID